MNQQEWIRLAVYVFVMLVGMSIIIRGMRIFHTRQFTVPNRTTNFKHIYTGRPAIIVGICSIIFGLVIFLLPILDMTALLPKVEDFLAALVVGVIIVSVLATFMRSYTEW